MKLDVYVYLCLFLLITIYNQAPTEKQSQLRRSTLYDKLQNGFTIYIQSTQRIPNYSFLNTSQRYSSSPSNSDVEKKYHHYIQPTLTINQHNTSPSLPTPTPTPTPTPVSIPTPTPAPAPTTIIPESNGETSHIQSYSHEEEVKDEQDDLVIASSTPHPIAKANSSHSVFCKSSRKP